MNKKIVEKDERTTYIENVSYSYGYKFLSFALLLDIIYRSLVFNEAPWDLLALIIVSGFVMTAYQFRQRILGRKWLITVGIVFAVTLIAAVLITIIVIKMKS